MATISLTKNAPTNMAFKIKTTTPERYRVRPSIGLIEDNSTLKIEVYYQPVNPESDDNTDILKDKVLYSTKNVKNCDTNFENLGILNFRSFW